MIVLAQREHCAMEEQGKRRSEGMTATRASKKERQRMEMLRGEREILCGSLQTRGEAGEGLGQGGLHQREVALLCEIMISHDLLSLIASSHAALLSLRPCA